MHDSSKIEYVAVLVPSGRKQHLISHEFIFWYENRTTSMVSRHFCQKVLHCHATSLYIGNSTALFSGPKLMSHHMWVVLKVRLALTRGYENLKLVLSTKFMFLITKPTPVFAKKKFTYQNKIKLKNDFFKETSTLWSINTPRGRRVPMTQGHARSMESTYETHHVALSNKFN